MFNQRQIKFVTTALNVILSLSITLLILTMLGGKLDFANIAINFILAFAIGCTVGDYIPVLEWGMKLAGAMKCRPESFWEYVISTTVLAILMVTFVSFFSMFIGMGPSVFLKVWIGIYPKVVLVAIIVLIIVRLPIMKLSSSVFKTVG